MTNQIMSRLTISRAEKMKARNGRTAFGPTYQPAIQVTRPDAPSMSKPGLLKSRKLGRRLHLLSSAELFAALLALYVPSLVDLQEQRMLWITPHEHPLASHPEMKGKHLLNVPGTAMVAKKLGIRHAIAIDDSTDIKSQRQNAFFPYVGDLLLILRDDIGLLRCVNWYVKKSRAQLEFINALEIDDGLPALKEKSERRYFMESFYYQAADIPTVPITEEDIDFHVRCNLRFLHFYTLTEVSIDAFKECAIFAEFEEAIDQGKRLIDIANGLAMHYGIAPSDCYTLFYQGIWTRRLRVDLFYPILPDKPLRRERVDLLSIINERFLPR